MRPLAVMCLLASMLAATSSAAATDHVRATLTTSSRTPVVDTPWRYTIVVKNLDGRPLPARAKLQILLGTTVVGCWKRTAMVACTGADAGTWIAFRGKRAGVLRWPARSAGVKLTFQTVVVAASRSLRLRAPVRVRLP